MTRRGEVGLSFAVINGTKVFASSMVGVHPDDRPKALCHECGKGVHWKAGKEVTPHLAHEPDSLCALTNPETAAHQEAKSALQEALLTRSTLVITHECQVCRWKTITREWMSGWSDVLMEFRVNSRRPDVVMVDGNVDAIAAIEVKHSHAVDEKKAADLAASGVPWIEVGSAAARAWAKDTSKPIPVLNADRATIEASSAACETCEARRRWAKEQERLREEQVRRRLEMQAKQLAHTIRQEQSAAMAEAARQRTALRKAEEQRKTAQDLQHLREAEDAALDAKVQLIKARRSFIESVLDIPYESFRECQRHLYEQRVVQLESYLAQPPRLRIAVGASVSGSRGPGVITFAKVGHNTPIHHAWFSEEMTWAQALKKAILRAVARLRKVAPQVPATILWMNDSVLSPDATVNGISSINKPQRPDWIRADTHEGQLYFLVSQAVSVNGHFVIRPHPEDMRACEAIKRVQDAASRIREAGRSAPLQSAAG